MPTASVTTLLDALRQRRLLEPAQLEEIARDGESRFLDGTTLIQELLRRGWLTAYQSDLLLHGREGELLLGSYVLLDRLGQGGMGQVFKARNWKLGRTVALKLIRKERLASADAVRRFQREIRAAAALAHPNIVHAFDADCIGQTHLLVMEHVEGAIDLAGLVKRNGPLPVAQACDCVRQAALGLQHAHERGLVHRDVKPANLLLSGDRKTVKVLDMGLARLDQASADGAASSTMTQEGAFMGTPDYVAPEQALESHTVDIRADTYSLGCTFYYLLAGHPPFPGGTLLHKLNRHQSEEPTAIERLRPDVPPAVAAIVRKMMAKRPEQRFQTPGEVAAALAALSLAPRGDERTLAEGPPAAAQAEPSADTLGAPFASLRTEAVEAKNAPPRRRSTNEERWLLVLVSAASLVLLSIVLLVSQWWKETDATAPSVKEEAPPKAPGEEAWWGAVAALPAEQQAAAVIARLRERNRGFDGKHVHAVEDGVVTELAFLTDHVTDLSPLRALPGLLRFSGNGSLPGAGSLADLTPLKDMKLTTLYCNKTQVADLTPLKDMKLTYLSCQGTQIADLTPLKDMKLTYLHCAGTKVADLLPLKDMMLTFLDCRGTKVADLTPLKDMKLTYLACGGTQVATLTPLKDMKLTCLECYGTRVTDLSPLKDMKLTTLHCAGTRVSDLTPLKNMKLGYLHCGGTKVADLSPLKDMKLTYLHCGGTKVADLTPLRGMPLKVIECDFQPRRDAALLRSLTTLEEINGKPAKVFWNEVDAKKP